MAILVHYFSLAGFVWIFLEAGMLYLKLISVYGGEFVKIKRFMLFGWGMFYFNIVHFYIKNFSNLNLAIFRIGNRIHDQYE